MALLYVVAANLTVKKGGAGRELAADACKEFSAISSRCNKVMWAMRSSFHWGLHTSRLFSFFSPPPALSALKLAAVQSVWSPKFLPVSRTCLSHHGLTGAWRCVCMCIKLHTLSEIAYKMDLNAEVPCSSQWIGRFHFSICPSKSEVVASQPVYTEGSWFWRSMWERKKKKKKISFCPWLYILFSIWMTPISP